MKLGREVREAAETRRLPLNSAIGNCAILESAGSDESGDGSLAMEGV